MGNRFVISDTHFGHANICTFVDYDGVKVRPWDNSDEMDEVMVANWNGVVKTGDTVYHLGDVAINRRHLATLDRLNGRKILVKGNHDIFKLSDYLPHFDDIRACIVRDGLFLSHIPIHADCLARFKVNVHGHLHRNKIADPRYVNVCVENVDYTPVAWEDLLMGVENIGS